MGSVWVIVVAAGSGSRFGTPKQYEDLGGRRVLDWSLAVGRDVADGVVAVVAPDRLDTPEPGADTVVAGGATRSASVRAGLAAVPDDADVVVVHDGARPLAGAELFARVVEAVREGADAAVPAVEVTDTLRHRSGAPVDRGELVAVQTPQAFRAAALRRAHAGEPEATDDASLIEAAGGKVVVVEGSPANLKITRPVDLIVAEALLRRGTPP
ncbi:MAG TPA: 2-C-methyl-D-erythritol 4-phosphate cytidylyltransferase [Acidimicrobiales bacterium]|jgi:2-C-methyl-D-erythritol 4-phosphate cytidylyltransferase|nr:2-C-methyl-D-erythritol 4-phosphate cytidylyltransferase [Acidimicrobiales bacterium]